MSLNNFFIKNISAENNLPNDLEYYIASYLEPTKVPAPHRMPHVHELNALIKQFHRERVFNKFTIVDFDDIYDGDHYRYFSRWMYTRYEAMPLWSWDGRRTLMPYNGHWDGGRLG